MRLRRPRRTGVPVFEPLFSLLGPLVSGALLVAVLAAPLLVAVPHLARLGACRVVAAAAARLAESVDPTRRLLR